MGSFDKNNFDKKSDPSVLLKKYSFLYKEYVRLDCNDVLLSTIHILLTKWVKTYYIDMYYFSRSREKAGDPPCPRWLCRRHQADLRADKIIFMCRPRSEERKQTSSFSITTFFTSMGSQLP
jgi:hypothetical protein